MELASCLHSFVTWKSQASSVKSFLAVSPIGFCAGVTQREMAISEGFSDLLNRLRVAGKDPL